MSTLLRYVSGMENINYLINRMITTRQVFLNTRLKKLGLSSGHFSFLVEIIHHQKLTQNELSRKLMVDTALTSRNIKKLVSLGYVRKEDDPSDRRLNYIVLTDRGQEISQEILKLNEEWYGIVSKGIPSEEVHIVLNQLKRFVRNAETSVLGRSDISPDPIRLPVNPGTSGKEGT